MVIFNNRPAKKRTSPSYICYIFGPVDYINIWFDGAATCFDEDYHISNTGAYGLEDGAQFDRFGCEI